MNLQVSELQQAVQNHQAGRFAAAETLYKRFLSIHPRHPDALHLLGVVAHQQKRHREAVDHISQAIAVDASHALYHCNLGAAYRALGEHALSERSFRESLRIDPEFAGAFYNLGLLMVDLGEWTTAAEQFESTVRLQPNSAEAYNNLGMAYSALNRLDPAVAAFRQAIAIRPEFGQAHYNLGNTLSVQGRSADAILAYQEAARHSPNIPEIHNNLGVALKDSGRHEEAVLSFHTALGLRPDYTEAHNNLGSVLHLQGKLDEAEHSFRTALATQFDFVGALTNLGNVYNDRGDLAGAVELYSEALKHDPLSAEAHFNRALAWLRAGDFSRGWPEYEWRWKRKVTPRGFLEPTWDGSPLDGRSLLLCAEQGIGDEIQFASCIPDILDRTCGNRVFLECDPRLVPLFARSFQEITVIPRPVAQDPKSGTIEPQIDLQIALGSLPRLVRPIGSSFPARTSYLLADPRQRDSWRQRFADLGSSLNVGITWRGGQEVELRKRRSTSLSEWLNLFAITGVRFVSLQYGDCHDEVTEIRSIHRVTLVDWPDVDRRNDIDGLAAQIAALDLVISVDNSTAHLAGALGIPVWTMLPFVSDWRWLLNRDTSPWYPRMKLFRQSCPGEWHDVFERVAMALVEFRDSHIRHQ